jgi:hypothetical protein
VLGRVVRIKECLGIWEALFGRKKEGKDIKIIHVKALFACSQAGFPYVAS